MILLLRSQVSTKVKQTSPQGGRQQSLTSRSKPQSNWEAEREGLRVTHSASEIPEEQEDARLLEEQHHGQSFLVFSLKRGFFFPCLHIQHSGSAAGSP